MNFKFVRKGIVIATLASVLFVPAQQIAAADGAGLLGLTKQEKSTEIDQNCLVNAVAEIQKQNTEQTIKIESVEEIQFNDKVSGKVFVAGSEEYTLVLSTPAEDSDWVGKVFDASVVKITERGDVWSKVESGNVIGYVKTENLITGKDAVQKVKEILAVKYPEQDVLTLSIEEIEASFSVGETREEETVRLAAEEAARIEAERVRKEAEEAARRQKGVDLVSYAKQFIGNPYVYGGTSLTRGTDCSGFVKSVYKHFGVSLPRTSYAMRRVGYKVSISEIQPGDIVCYDGHVGIYAGNGQIVNAIDEQRGIGMSNLRSKSVITVRRIF